MNKTEIGRLGERIVGRWLERHGYSIVAQNYQIYGGELDLVAENAEYRAFVEVKTRKPNRMQSGLEAITRQKQMRIIQPAADYMQKYPADLQPRFDIAEVVLDGTRLLALDYIENAFDTTGFDIIF